MSDGSTTQTGDKPMVTLELLPCPFCGGEAERFTIGDDEPNNAGGDVITCTKCQASSHVEFGRKENLVDRWNTRHREQEIREQPRPCAVCGDGLTTQMGASLKSKAESAATWMRRAATAEIELIQAREGLQKIATGSIDGEPSNYRDTLHIVRQIATDTLTALSPSPDLAEENERLREALGKIANGVERRLFDGTTVIDDHPEAMEIARATLQSISTGKGG